MPRSIVIVGSAGRLGAALCREWRCKGETVVGIDRAVLDLSRPDAARVLLEPMSFDVLVNCAAQTDVDRCEDAASAAFRVNADAAGELAEVCARKNARCIHVSTDYVFDGTKSTPYVEEDQPAPISVYGKSKLAGEHAVLAASSRHVVARVAWLFGPDRPSFVDQIIRRALESERVEAIADKTSSPTYTLDAAHLLQPLLDPQRETGVVHLCNLGECTWQEYGQHALDCAAAAGFPLRARRVEPIRLAEMKTFVAARPVYSPLATGKLAAWTGFTPRCWQDAVEEFVCELAKPAERFPPS